MLELLVLMKPNAPSPAQPVIFDKNYVTLSDNKEAPFGIEGKRCKCEDPTCRKWIWNCILWVHTQT